MKKDNIIEPERVMTSMEKKLKLVALIQELKMTRIEMLQFCQNVICANLHDVPEELRETYLKSYMDDTWKMFSEKYQKVTEYVARIKSSINN